MSDDMNKWRTELEAYRQSLIHEMTLPESQLKFKMKHIGLQDLILQGDIPDSLSGLVERVMRAGDKEITAADIFGDTTDLTMVAEMYATVIKACVVHPPIADKPDEDHLGISEIPFADREFIFNWANEEAAALSSFRGDTEGSSDNPGRDGETVRPSAE